MIICDSQAISVLSSIIIPIEVEFCNSCQIFSSIDKAIADKKSRPDTGFSYVIEFVIEIIFGDSKAAQVEQYLEIYLMVCHF